MKNEDIMKAILERIHESAEDTRKEMIEFRQEIRGDLRHVRDRMSNIDSTQVKQQVILEEHIRRTEVNERALELMRDNHSSDINKLNTKIEPLEKHVAMWGGVGKAVAILGVVASIVAAALKMLK